MNRIRGGTYSYPRYNFSNRSRDIHQLFIDAVEQLGIRWRWMNRHTISIARRDSVALMDTFVGPKA